MKYGIACIILMLIGVSCSVDYLPGDSIVTEKDMLVVNSFLEPEKPIAIKLYTTEKNSSKYICKPVKKTYITLKEDLSVIHEGICADTILQLAYYPKIGSSYSIEVSLDGYDTVSASTQIPDSISCKASVREYNIFKLTDFKFNPLGNNSLWIIAYNMYRNGDKAQYSEIYSNNILIDKINRLEGSDLVNEIVGSGYHEGFLRIKTKNLSQLDSLILTPLFNVSRIEEDLKFVCIKTIFASKEYDQYNKTYYQQLAVPEGGDFTSIAYQPVHVYSNINNGLGIFAGMNETNHYFEITYNK